MDKMKKEPLLRAEHLEKTFISRGRQVHALDDVSLYLMEGEILGIIGESGCGKSTLLRMICCLEKPDRGELYLRGERYTGESPAVAGRNMRLIFQDAAGSFDPRYTMRQSLREGMRTGRLTGSGDGLKRDKELELSEILRKTGLEPALLDRRPRELSGGQCQRMAVARALAAGAGILLCDEITSALDVTIQAQVVSLLRELRADGRVSMIFVTHDAALAGQLCDRMMVMKDGSCVEEGQTDRILRTPSHPYTKQLIESVRTLS